MEFIFDLLGEVVLELFGELLTEFLSTHIVPKWVRYTLLGILILVVLALLIVAVYHFGFLVLQASLCLIFLSLLVIILYRLYRICRYGILRPVKEAELPQIMKLYRGVIGKPGCNWSVTYPNEVTLYEDFRTGNLYALCKGKKIIGAGSIVSKNEQDDLLCWYYRDNAREIARIVIAPEFQGKGLGKYLVHKLCHRMKKSGYKAVHLLVSTENRRALNLYRATGFFSRGAFHRYDHDYYAFERKL